ncbi:MAG: aldo/keto reductase [Christensenellaceae bacterium]|nr:aldo/keto reductase [Christensenellaceae bacterium]
MDTIKLLNGMEIPKVFFGTYHCKDKNDMGEVIRDAYAAGYRALDTASFYANEHMIGPALDEMGVKDEVIITTKVWNDVEGYDATIRSFEESEKKLGKVDILLIHWPAREYISRWKAFETLYKEGRVKAIGVSNFRKHHLETLMEHCEILPMLDQIEAHTYFLENETIDFCQKLGIVVEAWRPLMRTGNMLADPDIAAIGEKYGKTTAQVALRYLLQNDIVVLPKSVRRDRMEENIDLFDFQLNEEDMAILRAKNTGKRTGDDPDTFILP